MYIYIYIYTYIYIYNPTYSNQQAAPAPFPGPAAGSHAAATGSVHWVNPGPRAAAEDAAASKSLGSAASPGEAWGQRWCCGIVVSRGVSDFTCSKAMPQRVFCL